MKILFIGDIVGQPGVDLVTEHLAMLRERHGVDVAVVNGENMNVSGPRPHTGFGMLSAQVEELFAAGVDVITSGNHAWDGPDVDAVLAHQRVLRPVNVPAAWPGRGVLTVDVGEQALTVLNIADDSAIPEASSPYEAFNALTLPAGPVLVDYHGDITSRKFSFAFAVDSRVTAVLGTHTHEPSLLAHLLPGGTGLVAEVGMTGPTGGMLGSDPEYFARVARGQDTSDVPPVGLADGPVLLGAVLLDLDDAGGLRSIRRVGLAGDQAMVAP